MVAEAPFGKKLNRSIQIDIKTEYNSILQTLKVDESKVFTINISILQKYND